jgi:hypothetical protein
MLLGRAWMQMCETRLVDKLNHRQRLMKLTEIKLMAKLTMPLVIAQTSDPMTWLLPTSVAHPRKRVLKNTPGHSEPQMK